MTNISTELPQSSTLQTPTRLAVIASLISSMKPIPWLKSLGIMLVAVAYASDEIPELGTFLYGSLLVGPILWGGLYLLNDITDLKDDRLHPIKKNRSLPSGKVSTSLASAVALVLIASAVLLSLRVNLYFFMCVSLMTIKQGLYTLPPFRFKERFVLDIVSGSLFNSTLRFLSGWFLVTTASDLPLLLLLSAELLQTSSFLGNRIYSDRSQQLERQNGYNSTVTKVPRRYLKIATVSLGIGSVVAYLLCSINGIFWANSDHLCVLPVQSMWLSLVPLAYIPASLAIIRDAEDLPESKAKKFYVSSHVFLFLFSLALAVIIVAYD